MAPQLPSPCGSHTDLTVTLAHIAQWYPCAIPTLYYTEYQYFLFGQILKYMYTHKAQARCSSKDNHEAQAQWISLQ